LFKLLLFGWLPLPLLVLGSSLVSAELVAAAAAAVVVVVAAAAVVLVLGYGGGSVAVPVVVIVAFVVVVVVVVVAAAGDAEDEHDGSVLPTLNDPSWFTALAIGTGSSCESSLVGGGDDEGEIEPLDAAESWADSDDSVAALLM
jgi:hypothetical protein